MRLKHLALGLAVVTAAPVAATAVQAADLYIPLFTYRTGPYAGSGIPFSNGLSDYFTMLNERDGGIGGVRVNAEECRDRLRHQEGCRML